MAPLSSILKRAWIPLVLLVVLAISGLVVSRLHRQFASQDLNAHAGAGIEIVQFNPKIMIYDVTPNSDFCSDESPRVAGEPFLSAALIVSVMIWAHGGGG